jgi:hypothetical protein
MPINGGLSYAKPENLYAGLPVNEIQALNKDASQQYQQNKAAKDSLDLLYNNLDLRNVDSQIKADAIQNVRQNFERLVQDGNYQDAQYTIAQAEKDFKGNQELQDALESRKKELIYQQGLKKRLDEGKITPKEYGYALQRTKESNNQPLKYNPDTFHSDNMFNGYNVLDNQSGEIYNKTFDLIKDWKASATPMTLKDGRQILFKTDPTGVGFAYDMQTGKKVDENEVYDAVRTVVENQYAPFLQQERDVENYNKFRDPNTGKIRDVNRNDINLVDDDIKSHVSGVSKAALDALKIRADKNEKGAKRAYEDALAKYNAVDVNKMTPEDFAKVYSQRQRKSQIDKYVTPAAQKAGFIDIDHKLIEDKAAEMALAHKYKKAEIEYEKTYTLPLPSNNSQLEEFTAQDYQQSLEQDKAVKQQLNTAQQRLVEAQKEGNPVYIANAKKEVDRLTHITEASDARQADYIKKLAEKDPKVSEEYLTTGIDYVLDMVAKNPMRFSKALVDKVSYAATMPHTEETGKVDTTTAREIAKLAMQDPNKDTLLNTIVKGVNRSDLPSSIVDAVQEATEKNKNLSVSSHTKVFGIDNNTDKSWEKPIVDRMSDLVKNTATNWLVGTTSLDQIVSGEAKDFKFVDEKGDNVIPDLSKSEIRPQIHHDSGQSTVRVLFKDANGKPIYRKSDDKKSQAAMTFTPSDQEGVSNVYKQIGETLKSSQDGNAQKQGREILGYTKWGGALAPIRLSTMEKGDEKPIILDTKEGTFYAKVVKGSGGFEVFYKDENGDYKPFNLAYARDTKGGDKTTNTFGSKEQFLEYMELNNY